MVCEKVNNSIVINHKFGNDPMEAGAKSEIVSEWRYIIRIIVYKTVRKSFF